MILRLLIAGVCLALAGMICGLKRPWTLWPIWMIVGGMLILGAGALTIVGATLVGALRMDFRILTETIRVMFDGNWMI